MARRAAIIVLDGVGIGEAPDSAAYGDAGSDTLGHVIQEMAPERLENLHEAGLGNIRPINGLGAVAQPAAAVGVMSPRAAGKDSTTGHWEIAGVTIRVPFPTYPAGFPASLLAEFSSRTGRRVIGNVVGSGTDVIARFGEEQLRTGAWIVYTSADSVFQIAAHEAVVPLAELYAGCEVARALLVEPNNVSRVIARPFVGESRSFSRTANRRDFSVQPPSETLLDALAAAGIERSGVGKVDDLFAGRSIESRHTSGNAEGIRLIQQWLGSTADTGFLFANLVDFDQLYGHRNNVPGFFGALREFDAALPALRRALREEDLLFITADHGNDPTTASTDHARENVPVLAFGPAVRTGNTIGHRATFADLGATVAEWFGLEFRGAGTSFLMQVLH
ncbi:MAG TPA: phosphopentomutase [Gemmatimonadaceae bacterium]|nr:phosphopentomutase [Gemmatimonadaceae bacterium]